MVSSELITLCETKIVFPHVHHFTFIHTEFHPPMCCWVIQPLKVKKISSQLVLALSVFDICVSSANFAILLLILFSMWYLSMLNKNKLQHKSMQIFISEYIEKWPLLP